MGQQTVAGHGQAAGKAPASTPPTHAVRRVPPAAQPTQLASTLSTAAVASSADSAAAAPVEVFATGVIPGVAGFTGDHLNPNPAEMPFPGPIMAPPPMGFAEPVDETDDVAKAEADNDWAKSQ